MQTGESRRYSIVPYDPAWQDRFAAEAARLRHEFGSDAKDIAHVGSTAVPGMAGKPLIDILVIVPDVTTADRHAPGLEAMGYSALGERVMGNSRLFVRQYGSEHLVNLHAFPAGHPHVKEMLGLRDYFREHPAAVGEYSELKTRLFREFPNDYAEYRRQKDIWMEELKESLRSHGIL